MTRETLKREACSARPITTRASRQQESATERLFGYALSAVGGYAKIDMSRGNVDDAGERGDGADSHRATLHAATGDVFKIVGRRSVSEQCGLNRLITILCTQSGQGTNRKGRRDGLTSW